MTPEASAARERKQKIFVAVGGLFLVAVLVFFTLPKLLGGSSSSSSSASAETTETTATTPIAAAQAVATAANGGPAASSGAAPTAVVGYAKLSSFGTFSRKDPFVQQQVVDDGAAAAPAADSGASGSGSGSGTGSGKGGGDKAGAPTKQFSTGGAGGTAAMTIVTVNGARQVLEPGMKFPAADPLFVLVAENPGSKSVVIGVAGGSYASGGTTTKLKVGHPLTLVNTTTRARYKITLVSVGSGDSAAQPAPQAKP
jgi:hypothetical protein